LTHERDGDQRLLDDKLMRKPQDAKPQATKASITPGVWSGTLYVIAAIYFDDEPDAGSEEVSDVVANDDLTPKLNAKLFTTEMQPEQRL
jgi:hypothetical protein